MDPGSLKCACDGVASNSSSTEKTTEWTIFNTPQQDTQIRDGVITKQLKHLCTQVSSYRRVRLRARMRKTRVGHEQPSPRATIQYLLCTTDQRMTWRSTCVVLCASFLMRPDSFSLPSIKMRRNQPVFVFWAVMQSFFRFTCKRCPCQLPSNSTPDVQRLVHTTLSSSEEARTAPQWQRLWSASPSQLECRVHNSVFHRKVAVEQIRLHVHVIETAKIVSMEAVALALHLLALQRAQHHDRHLVVRSVAQTSSGRKRFAEHPSAPAPRRHPWRLLSNCTIARGIDKHRSQPPRKRYVRLFALASEHLRAKCWLDGFPPCRLIESTVFHRVNHRRKNS